MASSYGWAALAGIVLAIVIIIAVWIRQGKRAAVESAERAGAAEDAARKAVEHEVMADVERRDLPAGVAGGRVRDVHKPFGG